MYIFKKKIFVYLRSSGHEEYKYILGSWGVGIYQFMYRIVTSQSNVIVVHPRLYQGKKSFLAEPSKLDNLWFSEHKKVSLEEVKLLYVGRIRVEKGIFSLFEILHKFENNFELSIVGKVESKTTNSSKIKYFGGGFNSEKLKKIYDEHNIFILPSFTEAHPKVVDEALARCRPVIIFEDIEHIIGNRKGVFVTKRNPDSLKELITYIMEKYDEIQKMIYKNSLPTKEKFINDMEKIIELEI